ncbi:peptidase S8/S53 domain-containing protein [Hypoxylon cercidicola]|nr:peptidase S8/S53 domain-containing protein [Hypoxylon cercidicola]
MHPSCLRIISMGYDDLYGIVEPPYQGSSPERYKCFGLLATVRKLLAVAGHACEVPDPIRVEISTRQPRFGKDATIAIVDSGAQYTYPALSGGIGPNYTVLGGYDLVGDAWPDAPAEPDNDPMDQHGHGTHAAGIIAGESDRFVGVAPGAKLLSFKVFGSGGYSNEEVVIERFPKAFEKTAGSVLPKT